MTDRITIEDHVQAGDLFAWGDSGTETENATFLTEPDGTPFQRLKNYRIWHHRPLVFRVCITFYFDANGVPIIGEKYTLPGDTSNVTLQVATDNGNTTNHVMIAAGIASGNWPTAEDATQVFVPKLTTNGYELALQALSDLVAPVPVYTHTGYYKPVAIDTTPHYAHNGYYTRAATPVAIPGTPVNVQLIKGTGTNATATWDPADTRETSFEVQTTNPDGSWGPVTTLAAKSVLLTLTSIGYAVTLGLRVRAVNAAGASPWSTTATVRFNTFSYAFNLYGTGNPPALIGAITANGERTVPTTNGNMGVIVTGANNSVPTSADFDRTVFTVTFPDGSVAGWTTPDTNAGPSANPLYAMPRPAGSPLPVGLYSLYIGLYLGSVLVDSKTITTRLLPIATRPAAPSNLTAVYVGSETRLTWTDNATNEDLQYLFFRVQGQSEWQALQTLPQNSTSYQFGGLADTGQTYEFYLYASNAVGNSDPSNTATITAPTPAPVAPTIASKSNPRDTVISLVLPPFTDSLGRAITYSVNGLPAGLSFNAATRAITGTLTTVATYSVVYTGTIGSQSASTTFTWGVTVPDPIIITSVRYRVVAGSGGFQQLQVEATPSRPDAIDWAFTVDAGGANFGFGNEDTPGYGELLVLNHNPNTAEKPPYTLYIKARPHSNPSAETGIYTLAMYGDELTDWTTLNLS